MFTRILFAGPFQTHSRWAIFNLMETRQTHAGWEAPSKGLPETRPPAELWPPVKYLHSRKQRNAPVSPKTSCYIERIASQASEMNWQGNWRDGPFPSDIKATDFKANQRAWGGGLFQNVHKENNSYYQG